jgi:ADP-ribosylglycohydrolase
LILGGLIGDALGGPVEFAADERVAGLLPGTRRWSKQRTVTAQDLASWSATLPLFSYEKLRPEPAPYGPWRRSAVAGTVTDDSRHKVILIRTIRDAVARRQNALTARDLARQYVAFRPLVDQAPDADTRKLCEEGLAEYRLAARWLLGERDEARALPVSRLWSGIANCSGQMLLPPLAAAFPGRPDAAYRAAYAVDFVDAPLARDPAAALVAGLAGVLARRHDRADEARRWHVLLSTMRRTDPYRLAQVPFAGRPLHRWMDLAEDLAAKAQGQPARLFQLLETEGEPTYWWDAHYTLLVPLTFLRFCQFNVLAALHLTLDFGHDTDSYAQVLGCLGGAVCGVGVFPPAMRAAVRRAVLEEYGEDVLTWPDLLSSFGESSKEPR